MTNIKGIRSTICTHKILLEQNSKNNIEAQTKVNPHHEGGSQEGKYQVA